MGRKTKPSIEHVNVDGDFALACDPRHSQDVLSICERIDEGCGIWAQNEASSAAAQVALAESKDSTALLFGELAKFVDDAEYRRALGHYCSKHNVQPGAVRVRRHRVKKRGSTSANRTPGKSSKPAAQDGRTVEGKRRRASKPRTINADSIRHDATQLLADVNLHADAMDAATVKVLRKVAAGLLAAADKATASRATRKAELAAAKTAAKSKATRTRKAS